MKQFIQHHGSSILGVLSGFDRLRFRGTFRLLSHVAGMAYFLSQMKVQLKEFGRYAESVTNKLRTAVEQSAQRAGKQIEYLESAAQSKEEKVQAILQAHPKSTGLICILSCVEPCRSYDIYRDRARKIIDLSYRLRKCLHYYHYYVDPMFGLVHVRTQTWFPFTVHICINGREWLARRLDAAKIGYRRQDNCFLEVENVTRAQQLLDRQPRISWAKHLHRLARQANPLMGKLFPELDPPLQYYWSLQESEWATDIMFRTATDLERLYPRLIEHSMQSFGSRDVMRFLGRKVPNTPGRYGRFAGEVVSDLKTRPEGVRIKHRLNSNSIKMYNKAGSVLRVETTINDPSDMKAYRPKEGDPKGPKAWRELRKGIADVPRRADISQAANERYLNSLAEIDQTVSFGQMLAPLCKPTQWKGKRVRALNPFQQEDMKLLEAISRGEFLLNGFRNRDLRPLLFGSRDVDDVTRRRQSAAVSRKLRLLRAHHLIQKLSKTHRYQLTVTGRMIVNSINAAKNASLATLTQAA